MLPESIGHPPLLAAIAAMAALGAACGGLLGFASSRFRAEGSRIAERIDALLPQTQCGQCGYPGCRPYAEAIAAGDAINKCPPGGAAGIGALASLLGVEPLPLNAEHGEESAPCVAFILEDECIGCAKCIQACPVDAIVGAAKQMHTVIAAECTGCDLCVAPCPVDCIEMRPVERPAGSLAPQRRERPAAPAGARLIASDRRAEPGSGRGAVKNVNPSPLAHPRFAEPAAASACIRCGFCAEACPAELLPQQLYRFARARDHQRLDEHRLFDCIECGACASVCPSRIPLVPHYRAAKTALRRRRAERAQSAQARQRFEARQRRIERQAAEHAAQRAARRRAAAAKRADKTGADAAIAAAIARAQARKAARVSAAGGEPREKLRA